MWLLLVPVFLAIFSSSITSASEPQYVITVPAYLEEGTGGKACMTFLDLKGPTDIKIELKHEEQVHIVTEQKITTHDHSECYTFQAPKIKEEHSLWTFHVSAHGEHTNVNDTKNVAIIKREDECIVQTDKSTYKPGDTVKFRVISVNPDFRPINKQDLDANRITQWLNVSTKQGFADLSFHLPKELALGYYKINIPNIPDGCAKYFTVAEYVPTKFRFNLNVPSEVSLTDKSFHLEACGSYIYGKPVEGAIDLSVCAGECAHRWRCKSYSYGKEETFKRNCIYITGEKTDKKGCVSRDIQLGYFNLSAKEYHPVEIESKLTEDGTGHSEEQSANIHFKLARKTLEFVERKKYYNRGFPYHDKVKVSDEKDQPMVNEALTLMVIKEEDFSILSRINLATDSQGIAHFTLNTSEWPSFPVIKVLFSSDDHKEDADLYNILYSETRYPEDRLWLKLFYSKSESLLSIQEHPNDVSCNSEQSVMVEYDVHKKILHSDTDHLHFFYTLLSKRGIFSYKEHKVDIKHQLNSQRLQGTFSINFHVDKDFFPKFSLLVFSVLPNGETIARAKDYNVSPCESKVKLSFSKEQVRPGENVNLEVTAEAGSLCSVRSVDKGYLLKNPHSDSSLPTDRILTDRLRLAFQKLPYKDLIEEHGVHQCPENTSPESDDIFNVHKLFLAHNLQILTNTEIKEPVRCVPDYFTMRSSIKKKKREHPDTHMKSHENFTRNYFPDTWLFDLIPVGSEGHTVLNRTTPHSITKWVTDAFCLGSSGFASVKDIELTTFQPYFIELILPQSVVQGEKFTIQAMVFSYVKKCILIVVSLSDSENLVTTSKKEQARCVCAGHSHTFSWDVSATMPKTLKILVDCGSLEVDGECTQDASLIGEDHRKDSVEKTIVIKALRRQRSTNK